MSNEITMSASLTINATNLVEAFQPESLQIDLASDAGSGGVQTIGTSQEALTITADQADGGIFFFRNTDATNYVEIGRYESSTFYPFLKLLPGEYAIGRQSDKDIHAKANTADVNLQYRMLSP